MSSGILWIASLFMASMLILMPTMIAAASKLSKPTLLGTNDFSQHDMVSE